MANGQASSNNTRQISVVVLTFATSAWLGTCSDVLGAIMVLYAPLLTINSGITDLLKRKLEEDRKREELAGTRTAEPPVAASQLAATLAAAGDA